MLTTAAIILLLFIGFMLGQTYYHITPDKSVLNTIEDWQTLIGAFVALSAALLTVRELRKQIDLEREKNFRQESTSYRYSRALMIGSINEIFDYFDSVKLFLKKAHFDNDLLDSAPEAPELKKHFSAEAFSNKFVSEAILDIAKELQLLSARLQDKEHRNTEELFYQVYRIESKYTDLMSSLRDGNQLQKEVMSKDQYDQFIKEHCLRKMVFENDLDYEVISAEKNNQYKISKIALQEGHRHPPPSAL